MQCVLYVTYCVYGIYSNIWYIAIKAVLYISLNISSQTKQLSPALKLWIFDCPQFSCLQLGL